MSLENKIYNFPTKHKEGFTRSEIDALCNHLSIDRQKVSEAIGVVTGLMKGDDMVIYRDDVLMGIRQVKDGYPNYNWD